MLYTVYNIFYSQIMSRIKNSNIFNIFITFKMALQSLIDNPKALLELINDCLKPKDIEKNKFGEVFTPMCLINEMLDNLDTHYTKEHSKSIFTEKGLKWFDPASGMGNFPIAVYLRLMDGLKVEIPNTEVRKKHIIENMLYMSELNKKNVFVCNQIFNINNEYKLNIHQGNSLTLDIKKEFGVDKFDIVIGNPPYNEELKTTGASALYNKFVEYYIEKCDMLCFVIPSRWFSGGKGLDSFRKNMLCRTDIVYIKHFEDASKIFGNTVSIKGGVNYFLKDTKHKGDCKFNGSITQLNKYDVFLDGKYHNITDKLVKFESMTNIYLGRYFLIESNDKRLKSEKTIDNIKCYVSKQKGFVKYIDKKEVKNKYDFFKVITTEASFSANSGFGNTFIGNLNEVHSGSYISFKIDNEQKAESLLSYMKCRLPNFMLSLRKMSQHINESTCKWIPLPPLTKTWKDDEVYKHFNLSDDDIKLINETNIVGYKNIVEQKEEKKEPCVYKNMTLVELKKLCKDKNIKGYSGKKKDVIIDMLNKLE